MTNIYYFIFLLTLVFILFMKSVSHAATYNIYFNNAEQGDNGVVSPSIVVKDGKQVVEEPQRESDEIVEEDEIITEGTPPDISTNSFEPMKVSHASKTLLDQFIDQQLQKHGVTEEMNSIAIIGKLF